MQRSLLKCAGFKLQELRTVNINNIKAIRREHKQKYSDPGGYDLITLPRVSI